MNLSMPMTRFSLVVRLLLIALVLIGMIATSVRPASAACGTTNIAPSKPITASTTQSGLPASAANDANAGTRWGSEWSDPQWVQIDLGAAVQVCRVVLRWEAAYARSYSIQISSNGTSWTTIYSTTTGDGGVDDITGLNATGRYIRMNGTARATQWGYSLWEFEVYAETGVTPTPSPSPTATRTPTATSTATRTPTATSTGTPPPGCSTTNAAVNRPATASSSENAAMTPNYAVDANTGTRWSSAFSDPQWIQVDLGSVQPICRVRLTWEAAYATAYQIQVSSTGASWTNIYSTTTGDGGTDDLVGLSGSGRYIRVNGTARATAFGYSLWEFEVYTGTTGALPDLTVTSAIAMITGPTAPSGCYLSYGPVELRVTVQNAGGSAAGSFVVDVNGVRQTVSGLGAGQSTTLAFTNPNGSYTITADVTNTVAESNEGNNTRTGVSPTLTPPPLCTPTPTLTVTTPPPGCGTGNVALGRPATASSSESAAMTANFAVDGNTGTRWSSAFSDPQWIQVDLGSTRNICRVRLNWEGAFASSYQIQVSDNATSWTTIYSTTTGNGAVDDLTGLSGSGRYIRMNGTVRGTAYGYSLWDFEAYAVGVNVTPTATPTATATANSSFWGDTSNIPVAQNVMTFKFLNRTNGRYPDSQVFWSFNGQTFSIAERPTFDMPANSAGRMYFYLGTPNSEYNDFIEFTIGPNIFNGNTTRVDAFGLKLAMRLRTEDGYDAAVGEDLATFTDDRAVTFQRFYDEVPAEFKHLAQVQAPYRIPAPGRMGETAFLPGGQYANYFTAYANSVGLPASTTVFDIFACAGYLADKPGLCAAMNRHIAHLAESNWFNSALYYQAGPANYYSKFWHDHSYGGLAYGFAYDDYADQSSFITHGDPLWLLVAIGW